MNEPTTLSPAEALRALADGKRLTKKGWKGWVELNDGHLVSNNARAYETHDFEDLYEYTEPTPKVVWVEYLCIHIKDNRCIGTEWYQCIPPEPAIWSYIPTGRKIEV
jgi:hypothetical protein